MRFNEHVNYRSLGGELYDAAVMAQHPDGKVDLEVWPAPHLQPLKLTRIPWCEIPGAGERGIAYPKPIQCQKKSDGKGYWICDPCESVFSNMLLDTGWHPEKCPERKK
jgi:hypothetical protein